MTVFATRRFSQLVLNFFVPKRKQILQARNRVSYVNIAMRAMKPLCKIHILVEFLQQGVMGVYWRSTYS